MSLDVTLYGNEIKTICHCCDQETTEQEILFEANITHNLNKMASMAGIYEILWRPIENGYTKAEDIAYKLDVGIQKLKSSPEEYKIFSASNGWGTYEQLVPWLEKYLEALKEYPEAAISISK